ncbi:glycosyltransferase [Glaciecola sp. 2405UD65-10]|uniref:glycosyltransferase n=1 Tax=Glaciecola sp. 2405UD65-10 TaxID=3397244 RepID=UPI003B58C723
MLVTVYITTYNRREFLERAINSVLNQTHTNLELIVADDGSTDGSQQYLQELQNNGVLTAVLNTTGASRGACFGRNKAIELAKGEFITGLDDDDYFEPWRVAKFIERWQALTHEQVTFSALFDSVVEHRKDGKVACYDTPVVSYQTLRTGNFVGNQVFSTTARFREVNGFDEKMPALQDWDTWLRLSDKFGDMVNINTCSYIQIQDHGGTRITDKPVEKIRYAFERIMGKLAPLTFKEKSRLLFIMYGYHQMNIKFNEVVYLILGGHVRRLAQAVKRALLR